MRIALLSRDPTLYSCRRLKEAAIERGHEIQIIDPYACCLKIQNLHTEIYYQEKPLPNFDVIIPRISANFADSAITILRQFELQGAKSINHSLSINIAKNKLHTLQILAHHNIPIPLTFFSFSPEKIKTLINKVGKPAMIIKLHQGSQGIGVVLAESKKSINSIIDAFSVFNAQILIQEYIKEAKGKDIRCFIIGGKVVAAFERKAKKGDFRSNLHRGGQAQPIILSDNEQQMAINATLALGLNVSGVDLLRAKQGSMIIEVNASPGFEGIEKVTGINIANTIIKWIEQNYK